jgi:hypothetical protein
MMDREVRVAYQDIKTLREMARRVPAGAFADLLNAGTRILNSVNPEHAKSLHHAMATDLIADFWVTDGTQETYDRVLGDTQCVESLLDAMCAWRVGHEPSALIYRYFANTQDLTYGDEPTPTLAEMADRLPQSDFVWARRESIEHMLKDIYELVCEAHHKSDEYYFGREENQAVDLAFEDIVNKIKEINGGKLPTTAEAEEDCKP